MSKLLLRIFLVFLFLGLISTVYGDDLIHSKITLKANNALVNGTVAARPETNFWVEIILPTIDHAQKIEFTLEFDNKIIKLEDVSTESGRIVKSSGITLKEHTVVIDRQKMDKSSIFVSFHVILKGKTEISLSDVTAALADSSIVAIPLGNSLPIMAHIEDSSWSRLKALFNN